MLKLRLIRSFAFTCLVLALNSAQAAFVSIVPASDLTGPETIQAAFNAVAARYIKISFLVA